jgi:hypothetical protein
MVMPCQGKSLGLPVCQSARQLRVVSYLVDTPRRAGIVFTHPPFRSSPSAFLRCRHDRTAQTPRLVWHAAIRGAEAVKACEWTEAERAATRRRSAELNLGRNLRLGYHGPRWTEADRRLLGQLPDEEVAARTGRTAHAVRVRRTRLGIPTARDWRRRDARQVQSTP